MSNLGRVNLLVGTNNSGKTSILEAIEILVSTDKPEVLWNSLNRRGEIEDISSNIFPVSDVRHLFFNHQFDETIPIELSGKNDVNQVYFHASTSSSIDDSVFVSPESFVNPTESVEIPGLPTLILSWDKKNQRLLPILGTFPRPLLRSRENLTSLYFVTTSALDRYDVISGFEKIVLTPEEKLVLEALQTIQPEIERIAPITSERRPSRERGGMMVLLSNQPERVPIGSMGDGIWRMLGIALSLVNARGGVLLIDEIDTGLHYAVLEKMWRLVYETAKRLDVQVFATTHSRDCYEALAAIAHPDVSEGTEISIQRIERDKKRAISFTGREIVIAAERGIEVR